jgi:hypothetical protein
MGYEENLDRIDRGIHSMKIEFERFFAGSVKIPPEELRQRLLQEFRALRNANINSAAENFRLGTLEARFNSVNELINRRLREREEGRPIVVREARPRYDAEAGITLGPALERDAVEALFVGVYRNASGPRVDLESFQNYLTQQISGIRAKTGCDAVQFRVAVEDGKPRLKAKPVSGGAGSLA